MVTPSCRHRKAFLRGEMRIPLLADWTTVAVRDKVASHGCASDLHSIVRENVHVPQQLLRPPCHYLHCPGAPPCPLPAGTGTRRRPPPPGRPPRPPPAPPAQTRAGRPGSPPWLGRTCRTTAAWGPSSDTRGEVNSHGRSEASPHGTVLQRQPIPMRATFKACPVLEPGRHFESKCALKNHAVRPCGTGPRRTCSTVLC